MFKHPTAALLLGLALLSAGCQSRPAFAAAPLPSSQAAAPEAAPTYRSLAVGDQAVQSAYVEGLKDPARGGRPLPLKVYFPAAARGPLPVVVFSHGGQGHENSREAYAYFGRHLASQGFVAIHPNHSKDAVRPLNHDRPLDLRFLMDQLEAKRVHVPGFQGSLNLDQVGLAGHSWGAYTTMAIAGAKVDQAWRYGGPNTRYTDRRFKAFVALSPSGAGQFGLNAQAWKGIEAPLYEMVGELEVSCEADGSPAPRPNWRLEPWFNLPPGQKHLAILPGATHQDFNDLHRDTPVARSTQAFVQANAALFFKAHLQGQRQLLPLVGSLNQAPGTRVARK